MTEALPPTASLRSIFLFCLTISDEREAIGLSYIYTIFCSGCISIYSSLIASRILKTGLFYIFFLDLSIDLRRKDSSSSSIVECWTISLMLLSRICFFFSLSIDSPTKSLSSYYYLITTMLSSAVLSRKLSRSRDEVLETCLWSLRVEYSELSLTVWVSFSW